MSNTTTSDGARAWLGAHLRRALLVSVCLAIGGALFVVCGSFIQVWADVGWVPFDELHALQYGTTPTIPRVGDFWGIMLVGVVVVPAILGGAGLSEAWKRFKVRRALLPLLRDENLRAATVVASSWSSEDGAVLMTVRDLDDVQYEVRDPSPLGTWHAKEGDAVGLWTGAADELVIGTGTGFIRGAATRSQ